MKKLLILSLLSVFFITAKCGGITPTIAQSKPLIDSIKGTAILLIQSKDSNVNNKVTAYKLKQYMAADTIKRQVPSTADTITLVYGSTIVVPADTLNALVLKFPTGRGGGIVHFTSTKKITNITYANGTNAGLPNATSGAANDAFPTGKNVAWGGSFGIVFSANNSTWYRRE